jgi:glycosyltransferase involved in cell wall biosynthesis
MKKLLLIGSASIHVLNYYNLVRDYFDDACIISNEAAFGDIPTHLVNFSIRNPIGIPSSIRKIRQVINSFQPTVIHIHQANSVAWLSMRAASGSGIPIVLTAWGDDILVHPNQNSLLRKMVVRNLFDASVLTSDSLYMAGEMQKLLPEKPLDIVVANFGIDVAGAPGIKENIIYSNRLHKPMYRIDAIINAFARFRSTEKGKTWKLYIAGDGTESGYLKNLVYSLELDNHVVFKGWLSQEENRELYLRSKIFVSVPNSDATSISLLEALAAGCIPVLSNLPANLEWVLDGVNGHIVKNLESDFITPALDLNWDAATELNRNLIAMRATKEVNRKKYFDIYNRVSNQ